MKRFHIGLRTIKTAAAVVISMILVNHYGTTDSRLIFAMLGAMNVMQPTIKESIEASFTQILGVLFGFLVGIGLVQLPIEPLVSAGIGIIIVITLYNALTIKFSPSLPCLLVVMICTNTNIQPFIYASGRFWDTCIGLAVGLLINILIFPYDNIKQLYSTADSLDTMIISFINDLFNHPESRPTTKQLNHSIKFIHKQLQVFSKQWILFLLKNHRKDYANYQMYEQKARQLLAHMEVLCQMEKLGQLNEENLSILKDIQNTENENVELNIITNYHVSTILELRKELLDILKQKIKLH